MVLVGPVVGEAIIGVSHLTKNRPTKMSVLIATAYGINHLYRGAAETLGKAEVMAVLHRRPSTSQDRIPSHRPNQMIFQLQIGRERRRPEEIRQVPSCF